MKRVIKNIPEHKYSDETREVLQQVQRELNDMPVLQMDIINNIIEKYIYAYK